MELARKLDPNVPVTANICPIDDYDWYYFGGLSGKVYTIDISAISDGIDPSLTLYNSRGEMLAFNDDYPRDGDTTDIKPRIESWRAPYNDSFFIKVRDAASQGRSGGTYTLELITESYGPTPTLIAELCMDLFEPDGVPEQARLMVVGEVQPDKRLCPTGDADWIRFFGKTGKTYTLKTGELSVGADTVMVLADRDGVSILDFNDDVGGTLASQIVFTPRVDGFYYVQVKNIGDVGSQYIGYELCLGVSGGSGTCVATGGGGGGGGGGDEEPTDEPTEEPSVEPTTSTTATTSVEPTEDGYTLTDKIPVASTNDGTFVDPAFGRVWTRSDNPVASTQAQRSWTWGPAPMNARAELYQESAGGLRQVQYFDKSRMEVNDFHGDRGSQWFVTNGLLVREMIQGKVQIGNSSAINLAPAQVVIAGDLDDPNGPTYASLKGTLSAVNNRTGGYVGETLSRSGKIGAYTGPERPESQLVMYAPETGHNISKVFWDYMTQQGPINVNGQIKNGPIVDWLFAFGYPISEPYWTQVKLGGQQRWVLIQAFERRVLTYTPDNPREWQVEMGNVGVHYYFWRYGTLPK